MKRLKHEALHMSPENTRARSTLGRFRQARHIVGPDATPARGTGHGWSLLSPSPGIPYRCMIASWLTRRTYPMLETMIANQAIDM
jgi:hypothetical protein